MFLLSRKNVFLINFTKQKYIDKKQKKISYNLLIYFFFHTISQCGDIAVDILANSYVLISMAFALKPPARQGFAAGTLRVKVNDFQHFKQIPHMVESL